MKKLLLAALSLLLALPALGQSPDSSQLKLKTDGGLGGDATNALGIKIKYSASAPSSPSTGQPWCDTTTTPCIFKIYSGSAWVAPTATPTVQTQADTSSFPGSPVDGQIFFSASPASLYIYSTTLSSWVKFATPLVVGAPDIRDLYTAAVIAVPGATTAATSGTAGSTSAGAYSYKISCRNATGGETDRTAATSNSVSPGASKSNDLSAIPTCATGGVHRNVYRSKANQDASGPWYFVANIADNTTTTYHDGAADASLVGLIPDINFSAPLPGSWTVLNLGTSGGCGGTGATRGSMVCYLGAVAAVTSGSLTTDGATMRASLSVASYSAGDYTLQYRVKLLSQNGDTYPSGLDPGIFGMRVGTTNNAARYFLSTGGNITMPFSATIHGRFMSSERTATGGSSGSLTDKNDPWPEIDAFPFWVRWVRRGVSALAFTSSDAVNWSPVVSCSGANQANAVCSISASAGASTMDHVEIPVGLCGSCLGDAGGWVEISDFTLQVN